MNKTFADHVTGAAFSLTLSRNMVQRLVDIANGSMYVLHRRGDDQRRFDVVRENKSLRRRGLVVAPEPTLPALLELTTAGQTILQLMIEAGLIERSENGERYVIARPSARNQDQSAAGHPQVCEDQWPASVLSTPKGHDGAAR